MKKRIGLGQSLEMKSERSDHGLVGESGYSKGGTRDDFLGLEQLVIPIWIGWKEEDSQGGGRGGKFWGQVGDSIWMVIVHGISRVDFSLVLCTDLSAQNCPDWISK